MIKSLKAVGRARKTRKTAKLKGDALAHAWQLEEAWHCVMPQDRDIPGRAQAVATHFHISAEEAEKMLDMKAKLAGVGSPHETIQRLRWADVV